MKKKYDTKNFYSNFNVLTNRIPEEQFYAVTIPDYLTLTYSCVVQTYYVEQLNKIVEAIEYASDTYWGNPQRYQFKASIDSFNTVTELPADGQRIVKSTFDIKIYGYIIPNTLQNNVSSLQKFRNKAKLIFSLEATDDLVVLAPNTVVDDTRTSPYDARNTRSIAANKYNYTNPITKPQAANFNPNLEYQALLGEINSLKETVANLATIIQALQNP